MAATPRKSTAAAADPESLVVVIFERVHYRSGASQPMQPGDRETVSLREARSLRSYAIARIHNDPDTRSVPSAEPARESPEQRSVPTLPGGARYGLGGLLIVDNPKLVR